MSFKDEYFSPSELRTNGNLIARLRAFEQKMDRNERALTRRITEMENTTKELKSLVDVFKAELELLKEVSFSSPNTSTVVPSVVEIVNKEESGKNSTSDTNAAAADTNAAEDEEHVDFFMMEPWQMLNNSNKVLSMYDGNPSISFAAWAKRFRDTLDLSTNALNDEQKINRLKFCLNGRARAELDRYLSTVVAHPILEDAMRALRDKFETGAFRTIAKQALSICTQTPGEKVFDFANRLQELVESALAGEEERIVQSRLLEEFLDKLRPELQFEVKKQLPATFTNAYELAVHFELLLSSRRTESSAPKSELMVLSAKLEELALLQKNSTASNPRKREQRSCYYCRRPGHLIRDCRKRQQQQQRSRSPENSNIRHTANQNKDRSPPPFPRASSPSRGEGNRSSPRGRVRFGDSLVSFVAILAVAALPGFIYALPTIRPMVCPAESAKTLWNLPGFDACPPEKWLPSEEPIQITLNILRPNTIHYSTNGFQCVCTRTKRTRRQLLPFGGLMDEYETTTKIPVALRDCVTMRKHNQSPAGPLVMQGDHADTNNTLDDDWPMWPTAMLTISEMVDNCHIFDTIIYTRFGSKLISTPTRSSLPCDYEQGACMSENETIIWSPDLTQQCEFIHIAVWNGTFASRVWVSEARDFALSFLASKPRWDCTREIMVADQGFATYASQILPYLNGTHRSRVRRNATTGLVYSNQLAAQLLALEHELIESARRLFYSIVRNVCESIQTLSRTAMALAAANPTLLARELLNHTFIKATLAMPRTLEISPCIPLAPNQYKITKRGFCYDKLPITFIYHGELYDGFLNPTTLIIEHEARTVQCDEYRYLYMAYEPHRLLRLDQWDGSLKLIDDSNVQNIKQFGSFLDFPEERPMLMFTNRIFANLSELYTPYRQLVAARAIEITDEIIKLATPRINRKGTLLKLPKISIAEIANSFVSAGLFGFLRGESFSAYQFWIFGCCLYVTISAAITWFLPATTLTTWISFASFIARLRRRRTPERRRGRRNRPRLSEIRRRRENDDIQMNNIPFPSVNFYDPPNTPPPLPPTEEKSPGYDTIKDDKLSDSFHIICDMSQSRVSGLVNNRPARFLIDTGSKLNICDASTAVKYDILIESAPDNKGVVGIGNRTLSLLGKAELEVEVRNKNFALTVHIMESTGERILPEAYHYDFIIGRDGIATLPAFTLNFITGTFEWINEIHVTDDPLANLDSFDDIFSKHDYDLGRCTIFAPTLQTTTEQPLTAKPFRVAGKYRDELKRQIRLMLASGVLEESTTPWVSNLIMVKKRNGSLRACVDFRPLNAVTLTDPFPLPRIDELLEKVAGNDYYSTLDLAQGFWQIPLNKETRWKCGIITPFGVFSMRVMPFGLKNAPAIFSRVMSKILDGLDTKSISIYMDDIIIASKGGKEEHVRVLFTIFARLRDFGLKLRKEKCSFLLKSVEFLGHRVSRAGYSPSTQHINAIRNYPTPTTTSDIKRFLGLAGFFRRFIANFAGIAEPLAKLLRRGAEFAWHDEQQVAFDRLREELVKPPVLRPPNYNSPFYLFTDASYIAFGAILAQKIGNEWAAIAYWSKTLNNSQKKLAATHLELAAIINSLLHFKPIIYNTDITIITDHRPLIYLIEKCKSSPSAKINRWLVLLQEITPKILYIKGQNNIADSLSRAPSLNTTDSLKWDRAYEELESKYDEIPYVLSTETLDYSALPYLNREVVAQATKEDDTLRRLASELNKEGEENTLTPDILPYWRLRTEITIAYDGMMKRGRRVIIPAILRPSVLKTLHRSHIGMSRMKARARRLMWWPTLNQDIEQLVGECTNCAIVAAAPPQHYHPWPKANEPWERVHIDYLGPYYEHHWLVLIDAFSKFPFVTKMHTKTTSKSTIAALEDIFTLFGYPTLLVSDNGPQLVSGEIEEYFNAVGVRHITSPAYHPSSNGLAERFVRTFKEGVKKILGTETAPNKVRDACRLFLIDYRATPHATTHTSPSLLFLGRDIKTPLDAIMRATSMSPSPASPHPAPKNTLFKVGDAVWLRQGDKKKWEAAVVHSVIGQVVYEVHELAAGKVRRAHQNQLRKRFVSARHTTPTTTLMATLALVCIFICALAANAQPPPGKISPDHKIIVENLGGLGQPAEYDSNDDLIPSDDDVIWLGKFTPLCRRGSAAASSSIARSAPRSPTSIRAHSPTSTRSRSRTRSFTRSPTPSLTRSLSRSRSLTNMSISLSDDSPTTRSSMSNISHGTESPFPYSYSGDISSNDGEM